MIKKTSWTFFDYCVIAEYKSNHAQKRGQICYKSVQLVRGSSFRNDLLQNPYFSLMLLMIIVYSSMLLDLRKKKDWDVVYFVSKKN